MLRTGRQLVALSLFAGAVFVALGTAQSSPQSSPPAASRSQAAIIRSVNVRPGNEGPTVEIIASRPLVPNIQELGGPPRLAIDLPNTSFSLRRKRFAFNSEQISAIRVDQFQNTPPITRVVVDLLKPAAYTWDGAGNRLTIRLRPVAETSKAPELPSVPAFTRQPQPTVVPLSRGSSHAVLLAGRRLAAGSSVTAGDDATILRLAQGGEVRVCPGTTVSVTSSQSGRDLMLGMSTGALEAHYSLSASTDSVVTPDFRILLTGPGEFDYAMSADSRGNTCIRALPGNTASLIVSELMGEGTYQVGPTEQLIFRSGRVNLADSAGNEECGCPPPAIPVMRAAVPEAPVVANAGSLTTTRLAEPGDENKPARSPVSSDLSSRRGPLTPATLSVRLPETAALPASQPNEVHVQVEAPIVYRATGSQPAPAPSLDPANLPLAYSQRQAPALTTALPPPEVELLTQPRGFFGKVKNFFAAMFR